MEENLTTVLIETSKGNIKVALYDETPLHRDNFIKLCSNGTYDGVLFHRVIGDFMIQTGDPDSKNAKPHELLGGEDPDCPTIPAEFRKELFHRKGALCAARQGDNVNPRKESSASQFYIVQGQVWDEATLDMMEKRLGKVFTPDQRKVYMTEGGTPHLDGDYTVFGQVVEGMDVVEKIQQVKTDKNDRPLEDIRILKAVVTKDLPQPEPQKKAPAKKVVKRPVRRR
jgi:peptidyl-prolyl cis-trans isomerase B (cyclophilin B)